MHAATCRYVMVRMPHVFTGAKVNQASPSHFCGVLRPYYYALEPLPPAVLALCCFLLEGGYGRQSHSGQHGCEFLQLGANVQHHIIS